MAPEPVTILVDHRERCAQVREELGRLGVVVEDAVLPVADFIVAERVGVERKTIRDLHRSIANRRLWRQVASLREDFAKAYLLVEGARLDAGPISRVGVRGALLSVIELRIVVIRSTDPYDTAVWLSRIAAHNRSGKPRPVVRSVPHGRRPSPENVLATLPGISLPVARVLLREFGSIGGVAAATQSELLSVSGIGNARAATLLRLLSGPGPAR